MSGRPRSVRDSMRTVIIDGDNVLRALEVRRPPAVEEFLQRLEMAAAEKDWEVAVIFDGPPRYLPRETGFLTVQYSLGKPADSLIERKVYQAPDRMNVVVVTHDRAESDLVRGLGALVWNAQRLKEEME